MSTTVPVCEQRCSSPDRVSVGPPPAATRRVPRGAGADLCNRHRCAVDGHLVPPELLAVLQGSSRCDVAAREICDQPPHLCSPRGREASAPRTRAGCRLRDAARVSARVAAVRDRRPASAGIPGRLGTDDRPHRAPLAHVRPARHDLLARVACDRVCWRRRRRVIRDDGENCDGNGYRSLSRVARASSQFPAAAFTVGRLRRHIAPVQRRPWRLH